MRVLRTFFWAAVTWGQWSLVHGKMAAEFCPALVAGQLHPIPPHARVAPAARLIIVTNWHGLLAPLLATAKGKV